MADLEGGRSRRPPPPRSESQKQKNEHVSAEIWSRMRRLRPHILKFSRGACPRTPLEHISVSYGVYKFILAKISAPPRLSIPGSATDVWHNGQGFIEISGGSRGGGRRRRPLPYCSANTLKSPLDWLKFTKKLGKPPKPRAPPLFQILDPPLEIVYILRHHYVGLGLCK